MKDWLKFKEQFEVQDVRQLKGNFLPLILKGTSKNPMLTYSIDC